MGCLLAKDVEVPIIEPAVDNHPNSLEPIEDPEEVSGPYMEVAAPNNNTNPYYSRYFDKAKQQRQPQILSILRSSHEVTRAGLQQLRAAVFQQDDDDDDKNKSMQMASNIWPDFFRWILIHQSIDLGSERAKGFFFILDEYEDNVATKTGLYDTYEELNPIQTQLDYMLTRRPNERQDEIRQLFETFERLVLHQLKTTSPLMGNIMTRIMEQRQQQQEQQKQQQQQLLTSKDLIQKDILPAITDEEHFVRYTCQMLEHRSRSSGDGKPRARIFCHALWAVSSKVQWSKRYMWIQESITSLATLEELRELIPSSSLSSFSSSSSSSEQQQQGDSSGGSHNSNSSSNSQGKKKNKNNVSLLSPSSSQLTTSTKTTSPNNSSSSFVKQLIPSSSFKRTQKTLLQ